jgi:hypothetical protein
MNNIIKFNSRLFEHLIRQRYTLSAELSNVERELLTLFEEVKKQPQIQQEKLKHENIIKTIKLYNDPLIESEKLGCTKCD